MAGPERPFWRSRSYLLFLAFGGLEAFVLAPTRFLPELLVQQGHELDSVGTAMSGGGFGSLLALPLAGYLASRAPRGAMTAGALVEGIALIILGAIPLPLWGTALAVAAATGGEALVFTSVFTITVEATPERNRGQSVALFWGVLHLFRSVAGPSAAESVIHVSGHSSAFVLFGAVGVGAALWRALAPMPTRHRGADEVERRASAWRQLSRPGVVHLGVVVFGLGLAFAAQEAFLTAFTEERRFEWISPFYAAYAAVLVLGRVALGSLPDRVGPRRTSLVSVAVLALFFVAMTQVETEPLFWLLGALAAAGNALLWPSLYSIAYARIATKAYANALCGFLVALAYMVGSVGFGLVGERGGIEAIYAGAAAVAIAAGLVLAIGYPRERERPLHSEAG